MKPRMKPPQKVAISLLFNTEKNKTHVQYMLALIPRSILTRNPRPKTLINLSRRAAESESPDSWIF